MKKKIFVWIAAAVVVVAITALLIFVLTGKNDEEPVNLVGVWKVATNINQGAVSLPENEYMVFEEDRVSDYRDGNTEPYVSSSYRVNGDVLELSDISRTYHIAQKTDSYIELYTSDDTFMTIVKAESVDALNAPFDTALVTGRWNVTYRPTDKPIVNEYLIFDNGKLADYRDNADQPAVEAEYTWNDNVIEAPELGIEMIGARVAADMIVLIDADEGYVWLLTHVDD